MNPSTTSMTGLLNNTSSSFQLSSGFSPYTQFLPYYGCPSSSSAINPVLEPLSKHGLQQPTLQPGAYMHWQPGSATHGSVNVQPAQRCQNCQMVEAQICKIQGERDMIQSLYQNLLIQTKQALPQSNTPTRPTPATHPRVRWWKKSTFDQFLLSSEGTDVASLGPVPYLETEDGEPVDFESLQAIRRTLRGAWTELANEGKAPQTWGMLSASASDLFNSIVESTHPLFKLADDNWKLKKLATLSYPAWRATHLDENCRLPAKGKKVVKVEDDESAVTGEKRKGNSLASKTPSEKRFKREKECSPLVFLPTPQDIPNGEHHPTETSRSGIVESVQDLPGAPPHESNIALALPDKERTTLGTLVDPKPTAPATEANDTADLANKAVEQFEANNQDTECSGSGGAATAANGEGPKKKRKYVWRPGTKKDARTLCALRWLKQTQVGGTGTAFRYYYDNVLNAKQRQSYRDEVEMLVSAGKWTTDTDVCDGPVY